MTLLRSLSPLVLGCAALAPLACADGDTRESSDGSGGSGQVTTVASVTMTGATVTAGEGTMGEPTDGGSASESASQATSNGPTQGTGDDSTGDTSAGSAETGDDTTGPDPTTVSSTTNDPTNDPTNDDSSTGEACAEVKVEAENIKQPADIIFVIDNSGSMDFEEAAVQDNMNDFSSEIIASGIDAHVVLLSNYNICIDPPLGSGGCPNFDTKEPTFLHINDGIGSNDALQKLIAHKADWEPSMRPDGFKHIVIVSDDDSDLSAGSFNDMFKAFGGTYSDYRLHAIVGLWDFEDVGKCFGDAFCCATIAAEGKEYKSLTGLTGGVLGALCDNGKQDFGALFAALSTEVISEAKIACEWVIPDAMGMDIDFGKVNVDYNDGVNPAKAIPKVDDLAACMNLEAWYYDDPMNPTKILACPALCTKIQGNEMASVDVKFGCETIVPQ